MILKAVNAGGEITALGAWEKRGWDTDAKEKREGMGSEDKMDEGNLLFPGCILSETRGKGIEQGEKTDKRDKLKIHCLEQFDAHLKSWATPTKHLYLSAMFIHPKYWESMACIFLQLNSNETTSQPLCVLWR